MHSLKLLWYNIADKLSQTNWPGFFYAKHNILASLNSKMADSVNNYLLKFTVKYSKNKTGLLNCLGVTEIDKPAYISSGDMKGRNLFHPSLLLSTLKYFFFNLLHKFVRPNSKFVLGSKIFSAGSLRKSCAKERSPPPLKLQSLILEKALRNK